MLSKLLFARSLFVMGGLAFMTMLWLPACTGERVVNVASTPEAMAAPVATSAASATSEPVLIPLPTATLTNVAPFVMTTTNPVHRLLLNRPSLGWLLLDQTHLYWSGDEGGFHIYRYPLAGDGAPEIIATSRFVNDAPTPNRRGVLGVMRPVLTGHLLFYLDSKYPALGDIWDLHVLNLAQGTDTVLLSGDNVRFTPFFTAQGDWLAVSTGEQIKDPTCDGDDTIVLVYNLKTHAQRELDRSCTHRLWRWGDPHLNGNELTVEQWLGLGTIKYATFNLLNDSRIIEDREEYEKHHPPTDRWEVVATGRALLLSDHETQQLLTVATASEDEWLRDAVIFGNTVAWSRILDFPNGGLHDVLLEWRTLP